MKEKHAVSSSRESVKKCLMLPDGEKQNVLSGCWKLSAVTGCTLEIELPFYHC